MRTQRFMRLLRTHFRCWESAELNTMLIKPCAIRMQGTNLGLDFRITSDTAELRVNKEDFAGLQAATLLDAVGVKLDDTRFTCENDKAIGRNRIARRT